MRAQNTFSFLFNTQNHNVGNFQDFPQIKQVH